MTASLDGFVEDRDGGIGWTDPGDEVFAAHLERVRGLGMHLCGRRLYETMLPWETDPAMRATELHAAFADVWSALPKVVFSRTLHRVEGNARLATGSIAEEVENARRSTDHDIEIGGAEVGGAAIALGLVDELHLFTAPVMIGGGTPLLPPITDVRALELLDVKRFGSGIVHTRYRFTRSD